MEVSFGKTYCSCLQLRTGCFVIGCYDIAYGHAMVLVYLASMYVGYFQVDGVYQAALWLDFVFTLVQILGGAVLVYGIKYKTVGLVLFCAGVGVVLMVSDVVGDVLLAFSFPELSFGVHILGAIFLIACIGIRGFMTFCIYTYYIQLKEEQYLKRKIYTTIPDIIK